MLSMEINRSTYSMSFIRALSQKKLLFPEISATYIDEEFEKEEKNKLNTIRQDLPLWNYLFTWCVSSTTLPHTITLFRFYIYLLLILPAKTFPVLILFPCRYSEINYFFFSDLGEYTEQRGPTVNFSIPDLSTVLEI